MPESLVDFQEKGWAIFPLANIIFEKIHSFSLKF